MSKILIIPAGQWGSALSVPLIDNGHEVHLWREKTKIKSAIDADFIILAPSSAIFRKIATNVLSKADPHCNIISVTKGLEKKSLMRPSEIINELSPHHKKNFAVLSGPNFAWEVANRKPTATVVASQSIQLQKKIQKLFSNENFRVYRTSDIIGVELGGILKNIVALAAGISDGMGCGDNARAALITRGFREIILLAKAEGARGKTLHGLSGIGDLILTCTSKQSRNYSAGFAIGRSKNTKAGAAVTIEGFNNVESVLKLGKRHKLNLTLFSHIAEIVTGKKSPQKALQELMARDLKRE